MAPCSETHSLDKERENPLYSFQQRVDGRKSVVSSRKYRMYVLLLERGTRSRLKRYLTKVHLVWLLERTICINFEPSSPTDVDGGPFSFAGRRMKDCVENTRNHGFSF